ncbi:MAG TPA: PD-(D/E)XK nuclease family protein [Bacteroidales bacterium]
MKKFLENVAEKIIGVCKNGSLKTAVILPNKRSEIFLKDYLKNKVNGPFWLPDFFTVDEFLITISGKSIPDPLLLHFELFRIHQQISGENQKSLDEFLSWAPIMLADFNDIDLYLADAETVFKHLSAAKVLEKWNLGEKPLTELQTNYLNFYHSLYTYYTSLNKILHEKNSGYNGMIYRHVAENIDGIMQHKNWNHFVVAGLNALSKAEKQVFAYLNKNYTVDFLWDADEYYMQAKSGNEAGRYIREMILEWKLAKPLWIENNLLDEKGKTINLVGIPKNIGQVKFAGQLIQSIFQNETIKPDEIPEKTKETALVLADENLLVPLLNSLPKIDLGENKHIAYNITMGYPMKNSPVNLFVNQWFDLLIRQGENSNQKFSVLNLLSLLKNPILKFFLSENDLHIIEQFSEKVKLSNNAYLWRNEIFNQFHTNKSEQLNELLELILSSTKNAAEFTEKLIYFLQMTKHLVKELDNSEIIVKEQFIALMDSAKKLHSLPETEMQSISLKALQKIFLQISRRNEITLRGEPLNGIQVMGMLETRTLDFKHIILLSANEGVLPKTDTIESFIPFDIRHAYNLPLPQDKTDVFAYHFYRLIQRAEKLTLVYNSEAGQLGGGEPSRYILQLKNELAKANPAVKINEQYLSIPVEISSTKNEIVVEKDENVMQLIRKKAASGLSPSALNSFIACPLRFYFSYIIKIRPGDSIEENMESDIFGSVIHGVFEEIYLPFLNKQITKSGLEKSLKEVDNILNKHFLKEFKGGNIGGGKNLLLAKVAEKFIQLFVESDIKRIDENSPLLLGVEVKSEIEIEVAGVPVKLSGIIDRVENDLINNVLRIIDYKTGKVEARDLKIKEWEALLTNSDFAKAFQLLFYTYVYASQNKINQDIEAGIYSMRALSAGLLKLIIPEDENEMHYLEKFEELLVSLLTQLLDSTQAFVQTQETDRCQYCDYKDICNR